MGQSSLGINARVQVYKHRSIGLKKKTFTEKGREMGRGAETGRKQTLIIHFHYHN